MTDGALSWLAMVAGATSATASCRSAATSSSPGRLVCYLPYEAADGWVTLRGAGAEVLGGLLQRRRAPGPDREAVRAPGLGGLARGRRRSSAPAPATSGGRSTTSTTAASSRCSTSTRRSTPSSCASARWSSSSTSREIGPVRQRRRSGEAQPHARRVGAPGPGARRAHRGGARRRGYSDEEIAALIDSGAAAGTSGAPQASLHGMTPESASQEACTPASGSNGGRRAAADEGAGRGLRRAGGDDQALPAGGPAARAGQDLAQHGLLPARVRRADPADQAAPGGALHAACARSRPPRRGPRAGPRR